MTIVTNPLLALALELPCDAIALLLLRCYRKCDHCAIAIESAIRVCAVLPGIIRDEQVRSPHFHSLFYGMFHTHFKNSKHFHFLIIVR